MSTLWAFSIGHSVVSLAGHGGGEGLAGGQLAFDLFALEGDLADLVLHHLFVEFGIGDGAGGGVGARALEQVEQEHQEDRDQDPQAEISQIVQRGVLSRQGPCPGYALPTPRIVY